MDAVGINIYGGGFTLGVSRVFNVVGQWEEIELGRKTFDLNFKDKIFRPLSLKDWPVKDTAGKVKLVYANPPCAPWSSANTHPGKTKASRFIDTRLELTRHTMEAAILLQPEIFISESVENAYNIGQSHYDQYRELWLSNGYSVTYFLTDAILHGAPCQRRRFHFIAHRWALPLEKPPELNRAMTVRDAIGDLNNGFGQVTLHKPRNLREWHKKAMSFLPPGGKFSTLINSIEGWPDYKSSFLVRRWDWDFPAPTMVNFNFIHPEQDRWITFREAMRVCTYPDSFLAHAAIEAVDAVLPTVAEYLAKVAKESIEAQRPITPTFSIIDWRPHGLKYHRRVIKGRIAYPKVKISSDGNNLELIG